VNLVDASWPIERAGEALAALAARSGLMAAPRELPAPGATLLADPDDGAIDRWFAGAAATLGLEAEAIDSDLGGVDDLLRRSPPSLLRVGADGRRLLLVLRGGRRALEVLPPDLRPRRVALAAVRGELCEPVLAPARAARIATAAAALGPSSARHAKAWVSRPSPARIAMASPNAMCTVGRPRRSSSSSIAGRSSWTSVYACSSSIAIAAGSALESSPPQAAAVASTRAGRSRLPGPVAA